MFLGFLIAVSALVYLEATKPAPINWFKSYNNEDKIPFGTKALYQLLEGSLEDKIMEIDIPPYEQLLDTTFTGTYLFINDQVNFDDVELNSLLDWVGKGNTLFVSANYQPGDLLDTLNIEAENLVRLNEMRSQPLLNLVNNRLKSEKPYLFDRDASVRHFSEIDTLDHVILGITQLYNDTLEIKDPKANYLLAPFGDGNIFLHNQPEIFSNYFLLKEKNAVHTQNVLSYINNDTTVYWDRHYKSGKRIELSPLYILLNNKYLKWAYYFVLIGALLFVLFEGKRKQRSIPIITPPRNRTFEYTRTISGMYFRKKDYTNIANKQIVLFFEYIRTHWRVPTERIDNQFMVSVASRSDNTLEATKSLFGFLERIQKRQNVSPNDLIKLNKEITAYKNKSHGNA